MTPWSTHAACGHALRWEHREDFRERRALALCQNPDCGVVTTVAPNDSPKDALAVCLLGPVAPRRYVKPWLRLYFRTAARGFVWRPCREVCADCTGEVTVQLGLPPLIQRHNDPYQVLMCLTCGATGVAWWLGGERISIAIDGSDWNESSNAALILKRVLEERAASGDEGRTWDFRVMPLTSSSRTEKVAARVCVVCGTSLAAHRSQARHCSGACRAEASRIRAILAGKYSGEYVPLAGRFPALRTPFVRLSETPAMRPSRVGARHSNLEEEPALMDEADDHPGPERQRLACSSFEPSLW